MMTLKQFLVDWPWTNTTRATFLVLSVLALPLDLLLASWELTETWSLFLLAGLGIAVAGHGIKRATTKLPPSATDVERAERRQPDWPGTEPTS